MAAVKYDIKIEQGGKFNLDFTWLNNAGAAIDLTDYTARMMVRDSIDSAGTIFSLTSGGGDISLGGVLGTVAVVIGADATEAEDFDFGVYDLELLEDGVEADAIRIMEGRVRFTKEVTHS